MSGPRMTIEQRQAMTLEQRLEIIEEEIVEIRREVLELRLGVDLAIDYSREVALALVGAEKLALLEKRAKERDARLKT